MCAPARIDENSHRPRSSSGPIGKWGGLIASANTSNTENKAQVQYVTGNVTNQVGNKLHTRFAFNNSWSKTEGLLATLTGSDPLTQIYTKGTRNPNYSLSGQADYTVTPNVLLSGRVGRYLLDAHDFNVNTDVRYCFANSTTNVNMPGVPANEQHAAGYCSGPSNSGTSFDTQSRNFVQLDATWFVKGAGQHQIKGGFQLDRRAEDVATGGLAHTVNLNWGSNLNGAAGPFGYYEVQSNVPAPKLGIITQGNVQSNVNGVFAQDTWSVSNRLTVNLGIRT